MKKYHLAILILVIFLIGCSDEITEKHLIGGHWIGTAGILDGEKSGEPSCYPFHEGIKFNDDKTVYVDEYEREFEYKLKETENGTIIDLYDEDRALYSYYITKLSENEIGLMGEGDIQADESCYLERE